jgi:DNA-binding XRE family transcriptional regulator
MDLDALHKILSEDPGFVRAYEELGDSVELAIHCRGVREERGITQAEIAAQAGVSASTISRFERLEGAAESVVRAIVHQLEPWLRQRGVETDRWAGVSPPTESTQAGLRS